MKLHSAEIWLLFCGIWFIPAKNNVNSEEDFKNGLLLCVAFRSIFGYSPSYCDRELILSE